MNSENACKPCQLTVNVKLCSSATESDVQCILKNQQQRPSSY